MNDKILELLYRSFDGELTASEQKLLEQALHNSKELESHKEEILKMRESLKQQSSPGFGYMFADRVMQKIKNHEKKSADEIFYDTIISIFKPLAFATTFLLMFWISYSVISDNGNLFNSEQQNQDLTVAEAFDPYSDLTAE